MDADRGCRLVQWCRALLLPQQYTPTLSKKDIVSSTEVLPLQVWAAWALHFPLQGQLGPWP